MDVERADQQQLHRVASQSFGKQPQSSLDKDDEILCAVFNKVVVSDVFPDEIAEDIVDDLVGSVLGEECEKPKPMIQPIEIHPGEMEKHNIDSPTDDVELSETGITKAKEVSSQMLLLCCWRSVKEICLFLASLSKTITSGDNNIVSVDQIFDISSFLMDLLTETNIEELL